ncbi:PREDICTED: uncharacterized protein LOC107073261 [Polistes dominula]|uniref:Uncharacterized protein LOC107073261 n=1 Tax=Polistes dominula TaxID=743375 RepID=A0ABM1JA22_POLDO|nr:PREDICTED: uncharacterized protein LOC107073261 [Polistes dominula]
MFFFDVNCFLIVFPPVLNAFLYSIGILEGNQLTLPLIENNIDHVGMMYFSMLIGQSVAIVMAVVVGSISLSTFLILEFSVLIKSLRDKIECIIYVVGSVFTLYINFYLGQTLLNHSNAVFEELCNVPFHMLSIHSQKLLLFMIARSGKPSFLSIGNMFVSSHEVFAGCSSRQSKCN